MGNGVGRNTRQWKEIAKVQRAKRLPCFWCGQKINYSAKYPDPDSFTADHRLPLVSHPHLAEDPGNVVSSHARCNWAKGSSSHFEAGLGNLAEDY